MAPRRQTLLLMLTWINISRLKQLNDEALRNVGRPITRGEKPPLEIFLPEKCVRHRSKLLNIVQKIWAPLGKLFAPPGVPSWLWA